MSFLEHPVQINKRGTQFDDKSKDVALYVGKLNQS